MKLTCDRSALVDKLAILARGVSTRSALPVLSGIMLQAQEGRLDLYSTDMELSIKASLSTSVEHAGEIVVPARLFTDVVRNLPEEQVAISENQALFKLAGPTGDVWIASRLIDGQFPNYKQLLPETFDHEVTLDRDAFMAAARRVSLLAQKHAPLRLSFSENKLCLL